MLPWPPDPASASEPGLVGNAWSESLILLAGDGESQSMPSGSAAGAATLQSTFMGGSRRLACEGPASSGVAGTTQDDLPAVAAGKDGLRHEAYKHTAKDCCFVLGQPGMCFQTSCSNPSAVDAC